MSPRGCPVPPPLSPVACPLSPGPQEEEALLGRMGRHVGGIVLGHAWAQWRHIHATPGPSYGTLGGWGAQGTLSWTAHRDLGWALHRGFVANREWARQQADVVKRGRLAEP